MHILVTIGLYCAFFGGAFLFALEGMGGSAFYLPLLLLMRYDPDTVVTTSLILNLVVALISFLHFRSFFQGRYFWPFLIGSIPGAFLGGITDLDKVVFSIIVVVVLAITALKLFIVPGDGSVKRSLNRKACFALGIPSGLVIGFVSGLIGIGGGLFLSPLLLLLKLTPPRTAAAHAGLFIVINSAVALAAHFIDGDRAHPDVFIFLLITSAGGIVGGYIGARRLSGRAAQLFLGAVLVLVAAVTLYNLGCVG